MNVALLPRRPAMLLRMGTNVDVNSPLMTINVNHSHVLIDMATQIYPILPIQFYCSHNKYYQVHAWLECRMYFDPGSSFVWELDFFRSVHKADRHTARTLEFDQSTCAIPG